MKARIVDDELTQVRRTLMEIREIFSVATDMESIAHAESRLRECYKKVAMLHIRYANVIRSHDLDSMIEKFKGVEAFATQDEKAAFANLVEGARYSIDMGSSDFDEQLQEMRRMIGQVRWRQDGYIRSLFMGMISFPGDFTDRAAFEQLRAAGLTCIENGEIDKLREILNKMFGLLKPEPSQDAEHILDEVSVYV